MPLLARGQAQRDAKYFVSDWGGVAGAAAAKQRLLPLVGRAPRLVLTSVRLWGCYVVILGGLVREGPIRVDHLLACIVSMEASARFQLLIQITHWSP